MTGGADTVGGVDALGCGVLMGGQESDGEVPDHDSSTPRNKKGTTEDLQRPVR